MSRNMNTKKALDVVILYSSGHLGSAMIMNKLLNTPEINIIGVVKAEPFDLSFQGRSMIKNHLKKVGWKFAWLLLWQRCIQVLGYFITLVFPFLRKRLKPAWKIASDNNIPILYCKNINDRATLDFISNGKPDLLVSAYFSQILKKEVISLPKLGVINLHPGWLPTYKGAMAYFWVLKNNSDKGGVTVHWIDEGIDTGEILARRSFLLPQNATQEIVLMYTAVIGARLLKRIVRRLISGQSPKLTQTDNDDEDNYYPMPNEQDFEAYFERRRYFRIRDVFGLLVFKKYRE